MSEIIIWYECRCPHCHSRNFLNNGDPEDLTVGDIEGFECWSCRLHFGFTEMGEVQRVHETTWLPRGINFVAADDGGAVT